jgi:hypothetical protein
MASSSSASVAAPLLAGQLVGATSTTSLAAPFHAVDAPQASGWLACWQVPVPVLSLQWSIPLAAPPGRPANVAPMDSTTIAAVGCPHPVRSCVISSPSSMLLTLPTCSISLLNPPVCVRYAQQQRRVALHITVLRNAEASASSARYCNGWVLGGGLGGGRGGVCACV